MTERRIQMWFDGNSGNYLDECPFSIVQSEDKICTPDYEEFVKQMSGKHPLNGRTQVNLYYIGMVNRDEEKRLTERRERLERALNQN